MKKLLVLFIGLFIMVNGAVFAQETDDKDESQDVVTGSVSTSAYYAIPSDIKPGEIQPMQNNGGIEAQAWLNYSFPQTCNVFNCWVQGKALTFIQGATGNYILCARVYALYKDTTNLGSGNEQCGIYNGSGGPSSERSENGLVRWSKWTVETTHYAIKRAAPAGTQPWTPFLTVSVQP